MVAMGKTGTRLLNVFWGESMWHRLLAFIVLGSILISASSIRAEEVGFERKSYNYAEWTKGRFAEVVEVRRPGRWLFLAGVGSDREEDGAIMHKGDFYLQCTYSWNKIKKLLEKHRATSRDIVKLTVYITDIRHFPDWGKCRSEALGAQDLPASTLVAVSRLAWPEMLLEIDVIAITSD